MQVFLVLSHPEPGMFLHIYGAGGKQWQAPVIKTYASICIRVTNTGGVGSLENYLGQVEFGFGSYDRFWVGKDMGQS